MKNIINIGIIGCGHITSHMHLPILMCFDNIKIKYLADIQDPEKLASVYDIDSIKIEKDLSIFPQTDVVLLAIPVGVREPYIEEFGKRDSGVFCEKPFSVSVNKHQYYLSLSDKISCNYMRVNYNSTRQIRKIIESNIFGNLKQINIEEGKIVGYTGKPKTHYQTNSQLSGGGLLMERGCHTISQLAYILRGYDFTVKDADIIYQNSLDIDIETNLKAIADYPIEINYTLTIIRPISTVSRYVFDNAVVVFNHTSPGSELSVTDSNSDTCFTIQPKTQYASSNTQAFYLRWKHFLNNLSYSSLDTLNETSLVTTELLEGIYKAGEK